MYSSQSLCFNCPLKPIVNIWIVSLVLASPMVIFPALVPIEPRGVFIFYTCAENPRLYYKRVALAYSLASTVFQYLLPISIVLFAYASICNQLRNRFLSCGWSSGSHHCGDVTGVGLIDVTAGIPGGNSSMNTIDPSTSTRRRMQRQRRSRVQRTYALLVAVTVTFILSWLPLNIVNIVADVDHALLSPSITGHALLLPFCHLMILLSAVVNPLLYGWLNDNFRREFVDLCRQTICGLRKQQQSRDDVHHDTPPQPERALISLQ